MTDQSSNQETVDLIVSNLKDEIGALKAEITAKKEYERNGVIAEIAELAKELDEEFSVDEAKGMSMDNLFIFKNQYKKIIDLKSKVKSAEANFVDRTKTQKFEKLSNYEVFDKVVDIVSKMWNLPILSDEHKLEVKYQHLSEGIEY